MHDLDRLGWAAYGWYRVAQTSFGVRCTSIQAGDWVDGVLAEGRIEPPEHLDDLPLYSLRVPARDGGRSARPVFAMYRGTSDVVRSRDATAVGRAFLEEIKVMASSSREDALILETATVGLGARRLIVPSGVVAATPGVTERLLRKGIDVQGARYVVVDRDGAAVRPLLGDSDDRASARALALAIGAGPSDDRTATPGPIDAIVTYALGVDEPTPASRAVTVTRLAGAVRNLEGMGGAAIEVLGNLVRERRCLEVSWGSPAQLVTRLGALARLVEPRSAYENRRREDTPVAP